jgi:hypothetical protein
MNTIREKQNLQKVLQPWKLFFFEDYPTRSLARKREVFLKTGEGRSWIKRKWLLSSTG